jgi:hypothetical protein
MVDDAGVAELVKYIEPTRQDTLGDEPLDDAAVALGDLASRDYSLTGLGALVPVASSVP